MTDSIDSAVMLLRNAVDAPDADVTLGAAFSHEKALEAVRGVAETYATANNATDAADKARDAQCLYGAIYWTLVAAERAAASAGVGLGRWPFVRDSARARAAKRIARAIAASTVSHPPPVPYPPPP